MCVGLNSPRPPSFLGRYSLSTDAPYWWQPFGQMTTDSEPQHLESPWFPSRKVNPEKPHVHRLPNLLMSITDSAPGYLESDTGYSIRKGGNEGIKYGRKIWSQNSQKNSSVCKKSSLVSASKLHECSVSSASSEAFPTLLVAAIHKLMLFVAS